MVVQSGEYERLKRRDRQALRWKSVPLPRSKKRSAEAKPSGPKSDPPPNAERKEHYCEGDDDVMAKQGNRDRPNPRALSRALSSIV